MPVESSSRMRDAPTSPSSPQPVDVKLGQIKPCVDVSAVCFRPGPPPELSSQEYANDFNDVRDFGRATSTVRTAEQTDVAFFWAENPLRALEPEPRASGDRPQPERE